MDREVGPLGEVLAEEAVGVLVAAALPGAVWLAEVDLDAGLDREPGVLGPLLAAVPGERPAELGGEGQDLRGEGRPDRLGRATVGQGEIGRASCRERVYSGV